VFSVAGIRGACECGFCCNVACFVLQDYKVPRGEEFAVEVGDVVGFYYNGLPEARVQLVDVASRPGLF
jgi:hypothetical protein